MANYKSKLQPGQYDVFDLTPLQKEKLKELEKAYKACIKAKMLPVNIYGSLTFYDKKFIADYGNEHSRFDPDLTVLLVNGSKTTNDFNIVNEWTDDMHTILLTPLGRKELNNEDLDNED